MRSRLLLAAAAATLTLAACSDSPTAPGQLRPSQRANDEELTCRTGYIIATGANGEQVCVPEPE